MKITNPLGSEKIEITSDFGPRRGRQHKGVDLRAKPGTRVTSVLPGQVVKSGNFNDNYGGQVLIKHSTEDGIYYSRYAHLRKVYVKQGESVAAGQKLGESGGEKGDPNAGRSEGPHLHFEFMGEGMSPVDPEPYLVGVVAVSELGSSDGTQSSSSSSDAKYDSSLDKENIVDKTMRAISKVAAPLGALASLKGASTKKESVEDKKLTEELNRIKQLL